MKRLAALAIAAALLSAASQLQPAPDFKLADASGKQFKLSDYRGKVVLLTFWATWCGGCKKQLPWFEEYKAKLNPDKFAVVGLSLDEGGWSTVKPFLAKSNFSFRMAVADKATPGKYAVESLPATFLIDRKGRMAATYTGVVDKQQVEAAIETLLTSR